MGEIIVGGRCVGHVEAAGVSASKRASHPAAAARLTFVDQGMPPVTRLGSVRMVLVLAGHGVGRV